MPSRFRTPSPPSLPSAIAVCGDTTLSIADASRGSSSRWEPNFQPMSTSFGSRVLRLGTIATSSKPYACLAFLPRPISTSTAQSPPLTRKAQGRTAAWADERALFRSLKLEDPSNSSRHQTGVRRATPSSACFARSHDAANRWVGTTVPPTRGANLGFQHRFERNDVDPGDEPARFPRIEAPRSDLERRSGARRDGAPERLLGRAFGGEGGDEAGEQDVSGADGRDGIDPGGRGAEVQLVALLPQERIAAGLLGDQHVSGSELGDLVECEDEVLLLVQLLADEALGLVLVRRDEERLGLRTEPQRLALRVEHGLDAVAIEVADHRGIEVLGDAARQRPGEDDEVGPAREVVELLGQDLELVGLDMRAPLVDLGVGARHGVDDRGGGPGVVGDADEVVEDGLGRQVLEDARAGAAPDQAGGDDWHVEQLERAGDVDPLPPRERARLARSVPVAELEVRHGQRAVDSGIQSDCDDHVSLPVTLARLWCAKSAPRKDARSPRISNTGATEDAAWRRLAATQSPEDVAGRPTGPSKDGGRCGRCTSRHVPGSSGWRRRGRQREAQPRRAARTGRRAGSRSSLRGERAARPRRERRPARRVASRLERGAPLSVREREPAAPGRSRS